MDRFALGIDLGGTKIELAAVDGNGKLHHRLRLATAVASGAAGVRDQLVAALRKLRGELGREPAGVGVGVAGQVTADTGLVRFAPNLDWHDVPLGAELQDALGLPVAVTNDVRAATWGEWLHGAGRGCDELVCLFLGTGVGGGIVSGGRVLSGANNAAGELGHMTISLAGPTCTCGNRGCLEAFAGGWAIAERAREALRAEPHVGRRLLELAGGDASKVTPREIAAARREGDPLASSIVEEVAEALMAGAASLANAFNPARLVLGGGVIEGFPFLVDRVREGIRLRALAAAVDGLEIVPAKLGNRAGVVGAGAFALRTLAGGAS